MFWRQRDDTNGMNNTTTPSTHHVTSADLYGDSFANLSDWTDAYLPVCGTDVDPLSSTEALAAAQTWEEVLDVHPDNSDGMRNIHVMSAEVFVGADGAEHTPGAPIDRRPGHRQSCPAAQVPGKGTVTVRTIVTGAIVRHETTTGRPADANGASLARKAAATRRGDAARAKKVAHAAMLAELAAI